ncbi:Fic family protein [Myroides odoratimimus]|uniref:Fic family protein n=1 Tax=Myroides odoratimimus TaxID=76832 RepID=UPI00287B6C3C|nr:RNA-binding domain-containing protein [Myroides odoratimimus]
MFENKHLEFKQQLTSDLEKEVVAFLNSNEEGVLYIGINNKDTPIGVKNLDQDQLVIKDRLKTNILPSCLGLFDLVVENTEGKNVIKIIIAGGSEKPYYIKKYGMSEKGTFIRIGSSLEPMTTKLIEDLYSKRTRNSISKIRSPKQQLQFQQLHIYFQFINKTLNEQFATNLELLTEKEEYNYVAYLMSDSNSVSVKVARYIGLDRVELEESNEFGYESLIKATHQVLDKLNVENRTLAKITAKERKERRLWNVIALREAVLNAFVHNDYTREIAPKFEIFDDRLEITSYGGLPDGLSKEEFFYGFSVPRNKEIIRIFKDLDLVEQLGSGVPRILQAYGTDCFQFSENFLKITLPSAEPLVLIEHDTMHDTMQDNVQENIHDNVQDTMQDNMQDTMHDNVQDTMQATIHDTVQATIQDNVQENIHDNVQDTMQDNMQDTMHDNVQDTMQDSIHDTMQDNVQDSIHDTMQDNVKDTMQDNVQDSIHDTMQDSPQVIELLKAFIDIHSREELQEKLGLLNRDNFRRNYLQAALEREYIALTIPDKPTSRNQRYYLTEKGKATAKSLLKKKP